MDVSTFFTRLLQAPKEQARIKETDDINEFDAAWSAVKEILEHPNERQLARGITSTEVPGHLQHIVNALAYEANRTDEDTTGACLEYFLRNDLLGNLERLCEADRPYGIKAEVIRVINNLVVMLSERFLVHNAVHRPLRRLLRSCVGDEPEEKVDGGARVFGAAGMDVDSRKRGLTEDEEGDLVDLMCNVCSRMRAYPPLLLIFFHDKGWLQPPSSDAPSDLDRAMSPSPSVHTSLSNPSTKVSKFSPSFEFLLFSYLLRYVHREGKTGDFARAGLLFLFDIAFLTQTEEGGDNLSMPVDKDGLDPLESARDAMAEYILDGDFADVMAAGLGASYSLLPSKLQVPSLAELAKSDEGIAASTSGGMHLGATLDEMADEEEISIPLSTDPDVRGHLDLILKLLGFVQDIVYRCNSPTLHASADDSAVSNTHVLGSAISDATLDAVQSSFLENVLYPSILECSPNDGSAVAVLTYLDVVFANLDDDPVLHRMIDFLMGSGGEVHATTKSTPAVHSDYFADEGRFTLKDLILDNIRSSSWSSATAAFRLLQTLLSSHCQNSVQGLLQTIRDPSATALARRTIPRNPEAALVSESFLPVPATTTDVCLQEVELYGSLIARIDPLQTSTELTAGYAGYLTDMQARIQADQCFHTGHIPLQFIDDEKEFLRVGRYDSDPLQHRMSPSDPLIRTLQELFGQFLCQCPDENVALTGVLTAIALCPNRTLAGWLVYDTPKDPDPWRRRASKESDDSSDMSEEESPSRPDDGDDDPFAVRETVELPAIYQILRDLVRQINRFRLDVDDFDRLLSERRQGLLFADHLDEAMNVMLDVEPSAYGLPSTPSKVVSPQPKKRPGVVGSLKSFLTPKRKSSPATPGSLNTPASLREAAGKVSTSPFRSHYEQTAFFSLEAHDSSPIASGLWSPAKTSLPILSASRPRSALSDQMNDGVSGSSDMGGGNVDGDGERTDVGPRKVTLSRVLDNCVILEEFLKEIVALITARRALGVDQVGFV